MAGTTTIKDYYEANRDFYGDISLEDVARDAYKRFDIEKRKGKSFEDWTKSTGDDKLISSEKYTSFLPALGRSALTVTPQIVGGVAGGLTEWLGERQERQRQEIKDAMGTIFRGGAPKPEKELPNVVPPTNKEQGLGGKLLELGGDVVKLAGKGIRTARETGIAKKLAMVEAKNILGESLVRRQKLNPDVKEGIKNYLKTGNANALKNAQGLLDTGQGFGEKTFLEKTFAKPLTSVGKGIADYTKEMVDILHPETKPGSFTYYATGAVEGVLPSLGLGVATTMITKNPRLGLAAMFPFVYGSTYHEQRAAGKSTTESAQTGLVNAATEVLSEGTPLGILTKAGGKFVTKVFKSATAEGIQETLNEAVQIAYAEGVIDEHTAPEEIGRRLLDAGIIGAIGGGGMAVALRPFEKESAESKKLKKDFIHSINETLKKEDSQSKQDAIDSIIESRKTGYLTPKDIEQIKADNPKIAGELDAVVGLQSIREKVVDTIVDGLESGVTETGETFTPEHAVNLIKGAKDANLIDDAAIDVLKKSFPEIATHLDTMQAVDRIDAAARPEPSKLQVDNQAKIDAQFKDTQDIEPEQIKNIPVQETPIKEIKLSKDVPQFKEGADAEGIVEPLKGSYERTGTAPVVLWERKNGKLELITGRHRLNLAKKTGEETIPTQILKESEGFTAEQAAIFDAESNIRDEKGSVRDYAAYFRATETTEEQASSRGLLSRAKGQNGFIIGKNASDELYAIYRNGKLSEKKIAVIAKTVPNDKALQTVGAKYATNHNAYEVGNYLQAIKTITSTATNEQISLFDENESWQIEADKMAEVASEMGMDLKQERNILKSAGKLNKKEYKSFLEKYGIKPGDTKAINKRISELDGEIRKLDNWASHPDIVADIKTKAGIEDDINGFLKNSSNRQKALSKKILNKQYRYSDGTTMSIREHIGKLHKNGKLEIRTIEEPKIKPMSRRKYNRANQQEQDAHERKMAKAVNKTTYLVNDSELGKTAYDYAKYLLTAKPKEKATSKFTTIIEGKEPWEMTREQFRDNPLKGFNIEKLPMEDIARANPDGSISLDPEKFFGHSEKIRKDIIEHEKAHFLEEKITPEHKARLMDNSTIMAYRGRNINEKLANMIQDGTLPSEVLAEYPELSKTVVSKKKIGDAQKINNTNSIIANMQRIDGVDYELYNANKLKDKRGFNRIKAGIGDTKPIPKSPDERYQINELQQKGETRYTVPDENMGIYKKGDSVASFKTLTEAIEYADERRKTDDANKISKASDEKAKADKIEMERLDIDGFGDDLPAIQKGKTVKALNKEIQQDGVHTTLKELIRKKVAAGEIVNSTGTILGVADEHGNVIGTNIGKIGGKYAQYLIDKSGGATKPATEIFIRAATKKEIHSPAAEQRAFQNIPDKEGFDIAYKPFGKQGKGFYYVPPLKTDVKPTAVKGKDNAESSIKANPDKKSQGEKLKFEVKAEQKGIPKKTNKAAVTKPGETVNDIYKVWIQYANAMERKRPDSVLEYDRFYNYVNDYAKVFRYKNSYIIGQEKNGIFKPSHFAPASIREGLSAIRELSKYNNVVFAVTEDLAPMLEHSGYYISQDAVIPQFFGDKIKNKIIAASTQELLSDIKYGIQQFKKTGRSPDKTLNLLAEQKEDDLYIEQDILNKIKVKYQTSKPAKTTTLTKEAIAKAFARMKNVTTGQDEQGNFWFKFKNYPRFTIHEVDDINGRLGLSKESVKTGAFFPKSEMIWFKTGGVGAKADIGSLYHELWHLYKEVGVILPADERAIALALRKQGHKGEITEEDQATFIGNEAINREYARSTHIGRIIQKIQDFFDAMVNILETTSTGVVRKAESGKIAEQKKMPQLERTKLAMFQTMAKEFGVSEKQLKKEFEETKAKYKGTDKWLKAPNGKKSNLNEHLWVMTRTPRFKKWFGDSKVLDVNGEPAFIYSGHSNVELWGAKWNKKKATAGAFYATEDSKVASNYAMGKIGGKEFYENAGQYRLKNKSGGFTKKISAVVLSDEQLKKLDKMKQAKDENGDFIYPIAEMDNYIKRNKDYDKDVRSLSHTGGSKNLLNVWRFYEMMGNTISYAKQGDASIVERQQKNDFEELLDGLGIEWQSYEWAQPGVIPLYLSMQTPLDTSKPFPKDLLAALQKKAKREREKTKEEISYSHWTKDYPLKEWVKDIEAGVDTYWATQVPTKALPILKQFGYDGIKDTGGKGSGEKHAVWVAFEPTQIKSIYNTGAFDPSEKDIRFQMAGKKAIGADKGALAKAQKMLAEGVDKKEIWKKTGWLKGAEKEDTWKFEIDDSGAKPHPTRQWFYKFKKGTAKLSDFLDHPELYKAYPQLKDINLKASDFNNVNAYYDRKTNTIGLGKWSKTSSKKWIKVIPTLLHECQHAIQKIEGFSRGGSPSEFKTIRNADILKEKLTEKIDTLWDNAPEEFQKIVRNINQELMYKRVVPHKYDKKRLDIEIDKIQAKFYDLYKKYTLLYSERVLVNDAADYLGELSPQKQYLNLYGEIEARNASDRAKLTAEQRREQFPYESQGIPESDWIIKDGNGTSFQITKTEHIQYETKKTEDTPEQWAAKKLAEIIKEIETESVKDMQPGTPKASSARKKAIKKEILGDTVSLMDKFFVDTKHIKFKKGRPDFHRIENAIASPEFQFKKIPAANRVLEANCTRQSDSYELQKSMLDMNNPKKLLEPLKNLKKVNPEEHAKLIEFVSASKKELSLQDLKSKDFSFEAREAWHAWNRLKLVNTAGIKEGDTLLDAFRILRKKKTRLEFKKLEKAILLADINKKRLTPSILKAKGFSELAIKAWIGRSEMINRGLDTLISEVREEIIAYERIGEKPPPIVKTVDGVKQKIDLYEALKVMGDGRDHYSPRNRTSGRWKVFIKKKGGGNVLFFSDSPRPALKKYIAIKYPISKGYFKADIEEAKTLTEDVFEDEKTSLNTQQIVNDALAAMGKQASATLKDFQIESEWGTTKDGKKEFILSAPYNETYNKIFRKLKGQHHKNKWHFVNPNPNIEHRLATSLGNLDKSYLDAQRMFAGNLAKQLAASFEARGFLRHKIGRSEAVGKDVILGFETDPILNATQYVMGIAGGTAKRIAAARMMRAFTGTDISWEEFHEKNPDSEYTDYLKMTRERGISSKDQSNAFSAVKKYIVENLRNEELVDRVIGTFKSLAVFKYLAFRIPSAAVNTTVLATSLPATMASEAGIPIHKTYKNIITAANQYGEYLFGNKATMPKWQVELFDKIRRKGYHRAQFNKEAIGELQSTIGRAYTKMVEFGMYMFGITEQLNRVASIAGTYMALNEGKGSAFNEDHLKLSVKVSDLANGRYGKGTRPIIMQGSGVSSQILSMYYVFTKFSHTYLQNMYKMSREGAEAMSAKDSATAKRKLKALSYMMFAPAVLGGATAIPAWSILMLILEKVFGGDDPEEAMYKIVENNFGTTAENIARFGLPGAGEHGITIKHSLAIDVTEVPTTIVELGGAPVSVATDVIKGFGELSQGHYGRFMEHTMISAVGRPFKAYREATEGVRTRTGSKVFVGREHIKADPLDTFFTTLGFSATRIAKLKGKRWHKIKVRSKYTKMRGVVTELYKDYKILPPHKRTKKMYNEIMKAKREYNKRVINKGLKGRVPMITDVYLERVWKRSSKPGSVDIAWD